jgi:hypothetical protein
MKITNDNGLPEALVAAVRNDPYDKGDADFSVTELVTPPLMWHLERKHDDEIEVDAADRVYALLGQSVHAILERERPENGDIEHEVRLTREIEVDGVTYKVTGQLDRIDHAKRIVEDYKVTSVWKDVLEGGGPVTDVGWCLQNWLYRWLLQGSDRARSHGTGNAHNLLYGGRIVMIFRDWSKRKAKYGSARGRNYYPQSPAVVRSPLTAVEDGNLSTPNKVFTEAGLGGDNIIKHLIREHLAAKPRECSPKERWARETKYALVHKKGARSRKNFTSRAEAEAAKKPGEKVEVRPGQDVRCEDYCNVKRWCPRMIPKLVAEEMLK